METNLVVESSEFLGLGMGVVFLFIGIIIGVVICKTDAMSNIIRKIYPSSQTRLLLNRNKEIEI